MARSSCAATVPTLTLWDGLRAVRFKLWDERHERLVTFGEARQRVPAVPAPGRHPSGGSSTWAPESEVVSRAERRAVAVPACFRLWAGSPSGRCRGVEQASRDRNGDSRDSDGRPPTRVGRCRETRAGPRKGRPCDRAAVRGWRRYAEDRFRYAFGDVRELVIDRLGALDVALAHQPECRDRSGEGEDPAEGEDVVHAREEPLSGRRLDAVARASRHARQGRVQVAG